MNRVIIGDCRATLRWMAEQGVRVKMCVTSPPYFGLRDYGHDDQIGLEQTPQAYIESLVEVFSLVRDVLDDDGTLWLNIGDSYGRDPAKGQHKPGDSGKQAYIYDGGGGRASATAIGNGIKEKDLIGIPWRVAFALQADGWYLRQDIIWHKPNAMPESVKDRCTKAHEYLFLLARNPRYYFYARGFMTKYPEHDGFFRLRHQISKDKAAGYMEPLKPSDFPEITQEQLILDAEPGGDR